MKCQHPALFVLNKTQVPSTQITARPQDSPAIRTHPILTPKHRNNASTTRARKSSIPFSINVNVPDPLSLPTCHDPRPAHNQLHRRRQSILTSLIPQQRWSNQNRCSQTTPKPQQIWRANLFSTNSSKSLSILQLQRRRHQMTQTPTRYLTTMTNFRAHALSLTPCETVLRQTRPISQTLRHLQYPQSFRLTLNRIYCQRRK